MPTLKIVETITFPLGDEASPNPRPATTLELVYTDKLCGEVSVASVVVDQDLMGSIVNAKAALVECTSGGGTVKANGGSGMVLKPGTVPGFRFVNPDGGLTTLTLTTTGAARFRVYLFV